MKDILLNKIVEGHKNFLEFQTLVDQKTKSIEKSKESLKAKVNNNIEETAKYYTDVYVDLVLFGKDLNTVFNKLFFEIELFKELGYDGLPEEIVEFYNKNIAFAPSTLFVIKDNKVIEKEEGVLEKARKDFLENNQLIKRLNELHR